MKVTKVGGQNRPLRLKALPFVNTVLPPTDHRFLEIGELVAQNDLVCLHGTTWTKVVEWGFVVPNKDTRYARYKRLPNNHVK